MIDKKIKLLQSLVKIPSPSGYEDRLASFIKKYLSEFISPRKIDIDVHNNTTVTFKSKNVNASTIMIGAHADQLGFLINNIDREGYISMKPIGGHDISILRAREVLVLPERGKLIEGVIGSKPIHLIGWGQEAEELPDKMTDLTLDIGVRKRRTVTRYLNIGDPVVPKPHFLELLDNSFAGDGFDDKVGCFVLLEIVREISCKHKLPNNIIFAFSSQEEVGCNGAKELVRKYKPDLFIGVDVTHASDSYEVHERESGKCTLGKGPVVQRGINICNDSVRLLRGVARRNKIKFQYQATDGGDTEAGYVSHENHGVRILDIGIPLRNMHTPVEVVSMYDLKETIKLLKSLVLNRRLGR